MNPPKISIVTPSLNQGEFLEETILSILNQNYQNLEFFIIDGGSTDNSVDIIKKYESKLTSWESKKDFGQPHAINIGLKHCTGDIITFCNSDDIYFPGTFKYISKIWNNWKADGAFIGAFEYINEDSRAIGIPRKPLLKMGAPTDLTVASKGSYRLHQVSTFFTRQALDTVGRFVDDKYQYVFDRELLYRIVNRFPIYLDNKSIGGFRIHNKSKSSSKIIPFSEDFANLYRSNKSGNSKQDRKREINAKYHLFRGKIKYAKKQPNKFQKIQSLLDALWIHPISLFDKGYWAYWKNSILTNYSEV